VILYFIDAQEHDSSSGGRYQGCGEGKSLCSGSVEYPASRKARDDSRESKHHREQGLPLDGLSGAHYLVYVIYHGRHQQRERYELECLRRKEHAYRTGKPADNDLSGETIDVAGPEFTVEFNTGYTYWGNYGFAIVDVRADSETPVDNNAAFYVKDGAAEGTPAVNGAYITITDENGRIISKKTDA
jgi:hypothetical protein